MTDDERAMLAETDRQLRMSNIPRECKAVLSVALQVYTALMGLPPTTWQSETWTDHYWPTRSWDWLKKRLDNYRSSMT